MKQLLLAHGAHFAFVLIGVGVFFWLAYRPDANADAYKRDPRLKELEAMLQDAKAEPAPGHVRRSVARRGLLALGPLLGAVATGGVLYGISAGNSRAPGAVIWAHSGISALALLLVIYKVADLGAGRLRVAFTRQRLTELVSVALGLVSVPVALTGAALLFAPSSQSFIAYTHLISSVWWTGLLGWHLRRYLGPSLRLAFRPASADSGRVAAVRPADEAFERHPA